MKIITPKAAETCFALEEVSPRSAFG